MMTSIIRLKSVVLGAVIVAMIPSLAVGCQPDLPEPTSENNRAETQIKRETMVILTGVVLQKPWAKTEESWRAGGSEYYVLDVGEAEVEERSAQEGVILRPSEGITLDNFAQYIGKRVEVEGKYLPLEPYVPQSPMESYPMGPDGQPLPRGGGFQVLSIREISS
ncbi:hypothetical protein [[Phormidium] sp. ETS-05]|uniref:hypothetical protein n=1 Tax=[Phormidium] sp. ETS-05 TaxID=222819 RepID=UPI0018EF1850|nr:hypothetical protein [[Phormidium] sp. ETS-05]